MAEQHQDKRTAAVLRVKYRSTSRADFAAQFGGDISAGGIFIKTKQPLAVGTLLRLHLLLHDGEPAIIGAGRVSFRRQLESAGPLGMGVQFLKLDPASRELVASIVNGRGGAPSRYDERQGAEEADPLGEPTMSLRLSPPTDGPPQASFRAAAQVTTRPRAPRTSPGTIPGLFSEAGGSSPGEPLLDQAPRPEGGAMPSPVPAQSSNVSGTFFPEDVPATGRPRPEGSAHPRPPSPRPPPPPSLGPTSSREHGVSRGATHRRSPSARPAEASLPPLRPPSSEATPSGQPPSLPQPGRTTVPAGSTDRVREATDFLASTLSGSSAAPATVEALRTAQRSAHSGGSGIADLFDDLELTSAGELQGADREVSVKAPDSRLLVSEPELLQGQRTSIPPGFDLDSDDLQELSALEPEALPESHRPAFEAPTTVTSRPPAEPSPKKGQAGFLLSLLLVGILAFVIAFLVAGGKNPAALLRTLPPTVAATTAVEDKGVSVPARPTSVSVQVTSEPRGALLMVDGKELGETPLSVTLTVGQTSRLRARYPGYEDAEQEVTPSSLATPVELQLQPQRFKLHVQSDPAGAEAKSQGLSCQTPCELQLGFIDTKVELALRLAGFRPVIRTVPQSEFASSDGGREAHVSITLQALPELPRLRAPTVSQAERNDDTAQGVLSMRTLEDSTPTPPTGVAADIPLEQGSAPPPPALPAPAEPRSP